jgi:hypothetical protein
MTPYRRRPLTPCLALGCLLAFLALSTRPVWEAHDLVPSQRRGPPAIVVVRRATFWALFPGMFRPEETRPEALKVNASRLLLALALGCAAGFAAWRAWEGSWLPARPGRARRAPLAGPKS